MIVKKHMLKNKKQNHCHISTYQHSNVSLRCTTDHIRNIALVALHKHCTLILNVYYRSIKWYYFQLKIRWQLSQGKTFSQKVCWIINQKWETIITLPEHARPRHGKLVWRESSKIRILTGASKMVNLVVSVSKCALPTSTVFPCNYHNFTLTMSPNQIHMINKQKWEIYIKMDKPIKCYQQIYSYLCSFLLVCVHNISHVPGI